MGSVCSHFTLFHAAFGLLGDANVTDSGISKYPFLWFRGDLGRGYRWTTTKPDCQPPLRRPQSAPTRLVQIHKNKPLTNCLTITSSVQGRCPSTSHRVTKAYRVPKKDWARNSGSALLRTKHNRCSFSMIFVKRFEMAPVSCSDNIARNAEMDGALPTICKMPKYQAG